MFTVFYKFADGYFCYTTGVLRGVDRYNEIKTHGNIIIEKVVK